MHTVCLLVGSNINPCENTRLAMQMLKDAFQVIAVSRVWQTPAEGYTGPDYLNYAALVKTGLDATTLKQSVVLHIETALGRVRTLDKYADRTIDIDIITYDGLLLETSIWERPFAAIPVAELLPGLESPKDGRSLRVVADEFLAKKAAILVNHPLK